MSKAEDSPYVLIIDDDEDIRDVLTMLFVAKGIKNISTAVNGEDGFQKLCTALMPHVVLLDLMMPVASGWDFLAKVQAFPELKIHRIAILSAGSPDRASLGNYPFFTKPPDIKELMNFVRPPTGA